MQIPSIDFGGEGKQVHFAHANGFHPMMYRELISELLPKFNVNAKLFRPFWDGSNPQELKSWKLLGDDLIKYFDQNGFKDVIGIGHSMGGVASVLACKKRPDLFSKLILLEPVILPPKVYLSRFLPYAIRQSMIPPAKIALKRKDTWESKEVAYNQLKSKRVFKDIPDKVFKDYIDYGTKPNKNGGVSLSYSKAWESQIYTNSATNPWSALKSLNIPVLVVRGTKSNVLLDKSWELMKSRLKSFTFKEIEDGGHLVPFEKKTEISKLILEFIGA